MQDGTVIDGLYEVQQVIGRGGMGVVFRVTHREWNQDMAVKMPLPQLLKDRVAWERFVREAETWIDLGMHPNIVQCWYVRDYGGLPLLFLDYLAGGSLKEWFEQNMIVPGDWSTILDLAIQAVDGLAYSHSRGVVHRDVKPANLLVRGADRVCVTDFGIVKMLGSTPLEGGLPPGEELERSVAGGTAEYAAPEQWDGAVSPSVDIYSMGVILYEFCTGRRPFGLKPDGKKLTPYELVVAHRTEFAPEPREVRGDVPKELNDLILSCLEKDPELRPATMVELRGGLARVFQTVVGRPYPRSVPEAGEQRADALSNKGVSLWNLSKPKQALEAWRQACRTDARHPEAVYNRAVAEWRRGETTDEEVLNRLRLARAHLQLGLFLIELGRGREAVIELTQALRDPELAAHGRSHRAYGDALMYAEDFRAAEEAYIEALERMPKDEATLLRRRLAKLRRRRADGHIYFPKAKCAADFQQQGTIRRLLVDEQTKAVIVAGNGWLECWHLSQKRLAWMQLLASECPRFESDGEMLYGLDSEPAQAWQLATGEPMWEGISGRLLAISKKTKVGLLCGESNRIFSLERGVPLTSLEANESPVTVAAFSPDGQSLVTGDESGHLAFWDVRSGERKSRLEAHTGPVTAVTFLREGRMALSAAAGDPARFWAVQQGRKLVELEQEGNTVDILLDAQEKHMMARYDDDSFTVWEMGQPPTLRGRGPAFFTADGLLYERDSQVVYWSFAEQVYRRRWARQEQKLTTIASDPEGQFMLTGSQDGLLQWWQFDEANRVYNREFLVTRSETYGEAQSTRKKFQETMSRVHHFIDSQPELAYRSLVAARSLKGYAQDPAATELLPKLYGRLFCVGIKDIWERFSLVLEVAPLQVQLDQDRALILGADHKIRIFEHAGITELPLEQINAICRPPGSSILLAGSVDGQVLKWDLAAQRVVAEVTPTWRPVQRLCGDASGRYALAATDDGKIHLLDMRRGSVEQSLEDQDSPQRFLAATSDLHFALSGPKFKHWSLLGERPLKLRAAFPLVRLACLNEDGQFAFAADMENGIHLWHITPGRICQSFDEHKDEVLMLGLWENLGAGVSAGADGDIFFWDLLEGKVSLKANAHSDGMTVACAGHSGRFLATVGTDLRLKVWELEWELDSHRPPASFDDVFGPKTIGLGSFFRRR